MSVNLSAYVEVKQDDGSWKLVTDRPICSRLKYIIDDYDELPRLNWDNLSDRLKDIFKKDESGNVYATFHYTTLENLESKSEREMTRVFTKINLIVKAMGVECTHNDEGEDIEWGYGEPQNMGLTYQVNKELITDLQEELTKIRNIGQREAFDLFVSEHVDWGKEHRIVLVVS